MDLTQRTTQRKAKEKVLSLPLTMQKIFPPQPNLFFLPKCISENYRVRI
jgi:hypothetical protein